MLAACFPILMHEQLGGHARHGEKVVPCLRKRNPNTFVSQHKDDMLAL